MHDQAAIAYAHLFSQQLLCMAQPTLNVIRAGCSLTLF